MGEPSETLPIAGMPSDRLDSWKEIAGYLKRDVTTVQRWEKRERMPVHRHVHDKLGSIYAFRSELDAWMRHRAPAPVAELQGPRDEVQGTQEGRPAGSARAEAPAADATLPRQPAPPSPTPSAIKRRRSLIVAGSLAAAALLTTGALWWAAQRTDASWRNPLDNAQFRMATDFDGTEQAAAISRDGKLVAFVSDRDGAMDVWVSQIDTGQFYNLTRGRVRQLVNPAVRTLGFSPDAGFVTFWGRGVEGASTDDISTWAVSTLGGQPRPYLEGAAEVDWSRDGSRVVYHTTGPGDPTFVGDSERRTRADPIFTAAAGLHAHFPTWSPDGSLIYFVQGSVPDAMDVWRMGPAGDAVERITHHDASVSHPVLLDDRMLMYLVGNAADGRGARLHTLDLRDRLARPLGTTLDRYTSLAASADGRQLAATRANPKRTLWRLPISDISTAPSTATLIALPTGRGFSPRLGPGYLLYVASNGTSEGIWKLTDQGARELWSAPETRIFGGPEVNADGSRVAFSVEQRGKTLLYVMNIDGTNVQLLNDSLELRGAPAWSPDGLSIVSGASAGGKPQLFRITLQGAPAALLPEFAADPVWSPAGDFIVYSGADIGTEFPLKAATAAGAAYPMPKLTLTRGARRVRFLPGRRAIVTMRGDLRHKDLWLTDLDTGEERQLTRLPADFNIQDFDIAADGREIVVDRVQENSDVVLIELARRD
jgi:Tol biopolymer transport system component